MPHIEVSISKIDEQAKSALISGLTKSAADATKIPAEKFIVMIHELDAENIGIGGKSLKDIRSGL